MKSVFEASFTTTPIKKILTIAMMVTVLSACGFHLRGAVELPEDVRSVYLQGFAPGSQFPHYLAQNLKHADADAGLAQNREGAGFVLNAVNEQFIRREVSLSETGKANMYELSYHLIFDLQDPAGEVILAQQTITVVRDYFNPQVEVIGKSEEEGVIRKEMYQEAVRSFLLRAQAALHGRSRAP